MKLKKLLLVQPKGPATIGITSVSSNLAKAAPYFTFKAGLAPASLATVAALAPPEIEIDIWDEHVRGKIDESLAEHGYDLVGITGFYLHLTRAVEIASIFRRRGIPSALGGPGVSSEPKTYRGLFDHIFIGEAENTWPRFIHDFQANKARPEYRQVEKPGLADVPIPRWDLVPNLATDYIMVSVQTTRGCPFDCEFCDVIYLFGRKPRHKPIEKILEELVYLEKMGVRRVFFSDDNFIGQPSYTKKLLRQLIPLNNSFRRPLSFFTQLSINVARDDELLELLADANFWKLLIGIESANPDSLREAKKTQNLQTDILRDIRKIHSYGINIQGSIVLGFDHDGPDTFDITFKFIQESGIPTIALTTLRAYPGTKLWSRLRKEGRVLARESLNQHLLADGSNILHKNMTRAEVLRGFSALYNRVYSIENFEKRIADMIRQVKRKPRVQVRPFVLFLEERKHIRGLLRYFLFNADKRRRRFFLRYVRAALRHAPFMLPRVISLLVFQSSIQDFLPSIERDCEEIIEHETKHPPKILHDDVWSLLPDSFHLEYPMLFPSVYRRLSHRLKNRDHLTDALVEVFTDFIERFHKEYDQLGEQKMIHLQEICDRTIARLNQEDPTTASLAEAPPIRLEKHAFTGQDDLQSADDLTEIQRRKLGNEILKVVEQELRYMA